MNRPSLLVVFVEFISNSSKEKNLRIRLYVSNDAYKTKGMMENENADN
jgi:hypothetical protein